MPVLSVCVIVLNEAEKIRRCLDGVLFADEMIVVDAGSSDDTVSVAKQYTDKVYINKFEDFAAQKNFAVSKASGDWILSIDADEVVERELAQEIRSTINGESGKAGYYLNRINYMYGKRLDRYCQPDHKIRLFRKDKGRFVQPVHEYVECDGPTGYLRSPLLHYSISGFAEHLRKADLYTSLEVDMMRRKHGLNAGRCLGGMVLRPPFRFLQDYIYRKGFKEGFTGLIISVGAAFVELLKWSRCFMACVRKKGENRS
ncbi:MAG: glycosyltransferase family 2 protein [Candidatus Omnitrophica bacterium]|nr:glycosyltransferase family 2 protein [Candidatus Omnitrophota bacterium]